MIESLEQQTRYLDILTVHFTHPAVTDPEALREAQEWVISFEAPEQDDDKNDDSTADPKEAEALAAMKKAQDEAGESDADTKVKAGESDQPEDASVAFTRELAKFEP